MTITTDLGVTAEDIYRAQAHPLYAAECQHAWLERVLSASFDGRSETSPEQAREALLIHELHLAELYAAEFARPRSEKVRVQDGYEMFVVMRSSLPLAEFRERAAAQRMADLINGEA